MGPVKEIKSHIQMPKFILENYQNKDGRFYYYDIVKKVIGSNGTAKSTNTQKGYYSSYAEKKQNRDYEQPFSKVVYAAKNAIDKNDLALFYEFKDVTAVCKAFFNNLMARDKAFYDSMIEGSKVLTCSSEQTSHDITVLFGTEFNIVNNSLYDDTYATLIVNGTSKPFVLSTCGVFAYCFSDVVYYTIPVSPFLAISLSKMDPVKPVLIDNEAVVDFHNKQSFANQIYRGNGFVVSQDKSMLEKLRDEITAAD